jgi:hypothetical protein
MEGRGVSGPADTFDCVCDNGAHNNGGKGGMVPLLEYDILWRQIDYSHTLDRVGIPDFDSQ